MADPLSAIASVISVIQISSAVLSTCYEYIASVKHAPRDIQLIVNEVGSLKAILGDLKGQLDTGSGSLTLSKSLDSDNGPLKSCESVLRSIHEKLGPSAARESMSRFTWPFKEKTVQKLLEVIQVQKSTLILALHADEARTIARVEDSCRKNASNLSAILDSVNENTEVTFTVREMISQTEETSIREKMRQWLHTTDPSQQHMAAWRGHEPGTGDWLLSSSEYRNWKAGQGQLTWLSGISGCGKTVLIATVIEDIKYTCSTQPSHHFAYYYFDFNDAAKRKPESMLQSIVAQIVDTMSPVPVALIELYEGCGKGLQHPLAERLLDMIPSLLQQYSRVYIILDALDESFARSQLLDIIHDLHRSCTSVNIFLASRNEHDISARLLTSISSYLHVEKTAVAADVKIYVHNYISSNLSLNKWPQSVKAEIEDALVKGSDGMFRWAVCQMDSLIKCHNLRSLRRNLESLPKGLYQTYDRMLANIPTEQQFEAESVLLWLVYAESPLTLDAVAEALVINREDKVFNPDDRFFDSNDILIMCSSLVSLAAQTNYACDDSTTLHESRRVLQLAHYSVKEYIVSKSGNTRDFPVLGMTYSAAQKFLAEACLIYTLSFDKSITQDRSHSNATIKIDPYDSFAMEGSSDLYGSHTSEKNKLYWGSLSFRCYAALSWCEHYEHIDTCDDDSVTILMMNLFDTRTTSSTYEIWYQVWEATRRTHRITIPELRDDPLVLASEYGLMKTTKALLAQTKTHSAMLNMALIAAAIDGNSEIIQVLLSAGADTGHRLKNPLLEPTHQSSLIDDPKLVTVVCYTAVEAAVFQGNAEALRLLLQAGGDANLSTDLSSIMGDPSSHCVVLHTACLLGHTAVVRVLLDHGADMHVQGKVGKYIYDDAHGKAVEHQYDITPLEVALRLGHGSIVKLLVSSDTQIKTGAGLHNTRKARSDLLNGSFSNWQKMTLMQALGHCTDIDISTVKYLPKDSLQSGSIPWEDQLTLGEGIEIRLVEAKRELDEEVAEAEAAGLLNELRKLRTG